MILQIDIGGSAPRMYTLETVKHIGTLVVRGMHIAYDDIPNVPVTRYQVVGNTSKYTHDDTIQGSPSEYVWREIPGVTQVDEKGDEEGNTAVVTAYIRSRKHGIYIVWGINSA